MLSLLFSAERRNGDRTPEKRERRNKKEQTRSVPSRE
jgi:hypothetical protein